MTKYTSFDKEKFDKIAKMLKITSTQIADLDNYVKKILSKFPIDITNCNGRNLFAEAIASNNTGMIDVFKTIEPTKYDDAIALAARLSVYNEEFIYPSSEDTAQADEQQIPTLPEELPSIHKAARNGDIAALSKIIEETLTQPNAQEIIDSKDPSSGHSATMIAALGEQMEALRMLIDANADTKELLNEILLSANKKVMNLLIEKGKYTPEALAILVAEEPGYKESTEPVIATLPGGINVRLSNKGAMLHHAAEAGNTEAIPRLIKANANPLLKNDSGEAPIHTAVKANKKPAFDALLAYGSKLQLQAPTDEGKTVLHLVPNEDMASHIIDAHPEESKEMLQKEDNNKNLPIHAAMTNQQPGVADKFISLLDTPRKRAVTKMLHSKNDSGQTAITMAQEVPGMQAVLASHAINLQEEISRADSKADPVALPTDFADNAKEEEQEAIAPTTDNESDASQPEQPSDQQAPTQPKTRDEIAADLINAIVAANSVEVESILAQNSSLDLLNLEIDLEKNLQQTTTDASDQKKEVITINLMQLAYREIREHQAKGTQISQEWLAREKKCSEVLEIANKYWSQPNWNKLIEAISKDDDSEITQIIKSDPSLLKLKVNLNKKSGTSAATSYEGLKLLSDGTMDIVMSYNTTLNTVSLLQLSAQMKKANACSALLSSFTEQRILECSYILKEWYTKSNSTKLKGIILEKHKIDITPPESDLATQIKDRCASPEYVSKDSVRSLLNKIYQDAEQISQGFLPLKIYDQLQENKLDALYQDESGFTAMHYAVFNKADEATISILLPESDLSLRTKSTQGNETPLDMAVFRGQKEIVEHLLSQGAKLSFTHLITAIRYKHTCFIQPFVSKHPDFLVLTSKETGMNALMELAKTGNKDAFNSLFTKTLDIKQALGRLDHSHKSILHYIAEYGDISMAETFKKHHLDAFKKLITIPDKMQKLPVHYTANREKEDFAALYNILEGYDQKKGGFFARGTEHKSVLVDTDKKLSLDAFYKKYHVEPNKAPAAAHVDHTDTAAHEDHHHAHEVPLLADHDHPDEA